MQDDADYSGWGVGGIYKRVSDQDTELDDFKFSAPTEGGYIEYVYTVEGLKTAVGTDNTLVVNVWSPVVGMAIYGGTKLPENVAYSFDDAEVWGEWQNGGSGYNLTANDTEKGGLTFNPLSGTDLKIYLQANGGSVMIGAQEGTGYPMVITPDYRLQLGGSGSLTKVNLGVTVEGDCDIYVVAASAKQEDSGSGRYLKAECATGSSGTVTPTTGYEAPISSADSNCLFKYTYTGDGETVYFYSSSSGINIFYIYVSYDGKAPVFEDAVVVEPKETEIEGYLTVSVGDEPVTTNQEVTITVTEGDDDEITVELGNLAVSIATIANASVTFTPDATGEYENGTVSGDVYVSGFNIASLSEVTATGTYVVDEDGETTFTASFTYTLGGASLDIAVSFTTVEPVAEPEWLLVTDEYDAEQTLSGGNVITITFAELGDATQICIVPTLSQDENDAWGNYGAVLSDLDWSAKIAIEGVTNSESNISYDLIDTDGDEVGDANPATVNTVIDLEAISSVCTGDAFYIVCYSNVTAVAVYAYATELGSEDTEEGNEETLEDFVLPIVDLFNNSNVGDWGSNTTAVVNGDALVLTFVQGWGSYVFQNWSGWDLSAYDTAILTYSFDETFVSSGNYAQLIVEDNTSDYNTVSNSDNNMDRGVVTVDLTSDEKLDLTNIGQIAVQTLAEATITVEEIRFTVKSTTGSVEGEDEGTSTAISNVNVEVTEVARYNLMGQKISGAERGINIIVYSDGSAKKVLVK